MSSRYQQQAGCKPSNDKDAYIYVIVPITDGRIAAITSANEVLAVDWQTLQVTNIVSRNESPRHLTSLVAVDDHRRLLVGGSDGIVATFDGRVPGCVGEFKLDKGVTALACKNHDAAVGTELAHQQAVVSVWDLRQNQMRWQTAENNDDITALAFHPHLTHVLLSGGDDGLVSLFDTNIAEEDDSLMQAINHGPIHKAGFFGNDAVYALSSDQSLALHPIYAEDRQEEPAAIVLGDLRPLVPCEYVIDLLRSGDEIAVATGSHSKSQVDLVMLQTNGQLNPKNRIVLEGAHGEEIVRSIFIDDQSGTIFTAGEDGQIKSFKPSEKKSSNSAALQSSKVKGESKSRYKPY